MGNGTEHSTGNIYAFVKKKRIPFEFNTESSPFPKGQSPFTVFFIYEHSLWKWINIIVTQCCYYESINTTFYLNIGWSMNINASKGEYGNRY